MYPIVWVLRVMWSQRQTILSSWNADHRVLSCQWVLWTADHISSIHHTHTHTRLTALFPGLPGWAGTRKIKPIWILPKQETVSGSGIICAIRNPAPSSRQITTPAPHHSSFLQAGCPFSHPTNSVKAHRPFSRTPQEIPCVNKSTRISRTRWSKKKLNWSIHSIRKLMTSWHMV